MKYIYLIILSILCMVALSSPAPAWQEYPDDNDGPTPEGEAFTNGVISVVVIFILIVFIVKYVNPAYKASKLIKSPSKNLNVEAENIGAFLMWDAGESEHHECIGSRARYLIITDFQRVYAIDEDRTTSNIKCTYYGKIDCFKLLGLSRSSFEWTFISDLPGRIAHAFVSTSSKIEVNENEDDIGIFVWDVGEDNYHKGCGTRARYLIAKKNHIYKVSDDPESSLAVCTCYGERDEKFFLSDNGDGFKLMRLEELPSRIMHALNCTSSEIEKSSVEESDKNTHC